MEIMGMGVLLLNTHLICWNEITIVDVLVVNVYIFFKYYFDTTHLPEISAGNSLYFVSANLNVRNPDTIYVVVWVMLHQHDIFKGPEQISCDVFPDPSYDKSFCVTPSRGLVFVVCGACHINIDFCLGKSVWRTIDSLIGECYACTWYSPWGCAWRLPQVLDNTT